MRPSRARRVAALAIGVIAACAAAPRARACGCFAQPSPAEPVVQAGERLLFAHEDNQVVAYVQIRYQGRADQFAWLVPLPSVPTVGLGSDELFTTLDAGTQPTYSQTNAYCNSFYGGYRGGGCGNASFNAAGGTGGGPEDAGVTFGEGDMGPSGVAVVQASIGPYDYAVLKADDGTAMFQWLSDNRFFVPTGTMNAVQPYLHPGSYFLALKLKGGESTGAIVPVQLRYESDLPMIPITLTQVSAVENLGVQVWLLGEARAIPRNYYHVVLDEMPIWFQANYNLQLIEAVHAAPGKHGFITEYAGGNQPVLGQLDAPGRFGSLDELRSITDPSAFLGFLRAHGYSFDGTLLSILPRYIPEPPALIAAGVPLATFYQQYDYYLHQLGGGGADPDGGAPTALDAGALVDELAMRVVQPALDAGALIRRHPYLTRLYTALSPADMTIDPVFGFNADLPTFSNVHDATLSRPCTGAPWLSTVDNGFEVQYVSGLPPNVSLPAAQRVELLREAGPPEPVQDNTQQIRDALGPVEHGSLSTSSAHDGCGCALGTATRVRGNLALLLVAAAGALAIRGLRRRRAT